jgi:hypothetical protein
MRLNRRFLYATSHFVVHVSRKSDCAGLDSISVRRSKFRHDLIRQLVYGAFLGGKSAASIHEQRDRKA